MTSPFAMVYARLLELMPLLEMRPGNAVQAVQLINDWLAAGCDAELDILPAINKKWAHTPTGVKVSGARYFDEAVRRGKEERVGSAEHKQRQAETRAKHFAWKRANEMFLSTPEETELARYEEEHGAISACHPEIKGA